MSFPRYPAYKDSCVEWLGEMPAHWQTIRLRYISQCLDGQRIPLNFAERADKQGDIPYWGANSIVGYVDEALFDEDLVLLGEDGAPFFDRTKPVAFFSKGKIWPNNHVHVLRPKVAGSGPYMVYALNITDFVQFIEGSTRDKLTQSAMNDIPLPWPPISEQTTIAAFLGRETAKIDALVTEQQRLIELLKEKRQAVISHVVTKGLNPDAPMKPSGVEWLGEVPAHWEVYRLKHLARSIEQGWSPQCEGTPADLDNEWGVLKVGCVNGGTFNPFDNKLLPSEMEPIPTLSIRSGDLLISRANTRELVGSAAVAEQDYPKLMLCDKLYRIRFAENLCWPQFVCRYLATGIVREQIELSATGASSSMLNIGQSAIMDLLIAVPPFSEQGEILSYLERELNRLDTLTVEAQRAIALLLERRTALCSAAVTGQIDVRAIANRSAA